MIIRPAFAQIREELAAMLRLGIPVALGEIGWSMLGIVDTIMVGRISAEAIGAVSIGTSIYFVVSLFGLGLLLSLDYLVSFAFGAGRLRECHRWLLHGVYLSLVSSALLCGVVILATPAIRWIGIDPAVAPLAIEYLRVANWSIPPLLVFTALRRYLQAIDLVRPVMVALFLANAINGVANWLLVFGHWGMPRLEAAGAAYATVFAKIFMMLVLAGYLYVRERRRPTGLFEIPLRPAPADFMRMMRLGLPVAMQILLEVGIFGLAALLAGRLNAVALAAHQVAIKIASLMFMVPLGISAAGAVRVGQALGAANPPRARLAGWTALGLGAGFMAFSAALLVTIPRIFAAIFTNDAEVISLGVSLLYLAALFQIFDGLQIVGAGVLRGAGETRKPMIWNLIAHWLIGLPIGYSLCFIFGWGVFGLWVGLCIGLIIVATALVLAWRGLSARFMVAP